MVAAGRFDEQPRILTEVVDVGFRNVVLKNDDVEYKPRRQPLKVKPDTKLIAVTRIESQKTTGQPTTLSDTQKQKLVDLVSRNARCRRLLRREHFFCKTVQLLPLP